MLSRNQKKVSLPSASPIDQQEDRSEIHDKSSGKPTTQSKTDKVAWMTASIDRAFAAERNSKTQADQKEKFIERRKEILTQLVEESKDEERKEQGLGPQETCDSRILKIKAMCKATIVKTNTTKISAKSLEQCHSSLIVFYVSFSKSFMSLMSLWSLVA